MADKIVEMDRNLDEESVRMLLTEDLNQPIKDIDELKTKVGELKTDNIFKFLDLYQKDVSVIGRNLDIHPTENSVINLKKGLYYQGANLEIDFGDNNDIESARIYLEEHGIKVKAIRKIEEKNLPMAHMEYGWNIEPEENPVAFNFSFGKEKGNKTVTLSNYIQYTEAGLEYAAKVIGVDRGQLKSSLISGMEKLKENVGSEISQLSDFLIDPEVFGAFKDEMHKAIVTVFHDMDGGPGVQQKVIDMLRKSKQNLIYTIWDNIQLGFHVESLNDTNFEVALTSIKDRFLNNRSKLILSRGCRDPEDLFEKTGEIKETQLYKMYMGENTRIHGSLINSDLGEEFGGGNCYYLHFRDAAALQCYFYTEDVDQPSGRVWMQNGEDIDKFWLSYVDAKLLWSFKEQQGGRFLEARTYKSSERKNAEIEIPFEDIYEICIPEGKSYPMDKIPFPPELIKTVKSRRN